MHRFPNQFPIVQENATKLIVWGEPGKLVLILFPYYGRFFPSDSYFMVYFVTTEEMHGFPHQNPLCELSSCFSSVLLFLLLTKSIDSLKEKNLIS